MEGVNIADVRMVGSKGVYDRIQTDKAFSKYVKHSVGRFWMGDWGDVSDRLKADNDTAFGKLNQGAYDRITAIYKSMPVGVTSIDLPMPEIHIVREITDADGRQSVTVQLSGER